MDERRRNFEPCLWEVPDEPEDIRGGEYQRVKQVWFEGGHADIGGGRAECGLSDITLRWMVDEAETVGLVFDRDRLEVLRRRCGEIPDHMRRHARLALGFRALNLLRALRNPRSDRFHWDSWRRLAAPHDRCVRLASTVRDGAHTPVNLRRRRDELGGPIPDPLIERTGDEIIGTPEPARHPERAIAPAADAAPDEPGAGFPGGSAARSDVRSAHQQCHR